MNKKRQQKKQGDKISCIILDSNSSPKKENKEIEIDSSLKNKFKFKQRNTRLFTSQNDVYKTMDSYNKNSRLTGDKSEIPNNLSVKSKSIETKSARRNNIDSRLENCMSSSLLQVIGSNQNNSPQKTLFTNYKLSNCVKNKSRHRKPVAAANKNTNSGKGYLSMLEHRRLISRSRGKAVQGL